MAYELEIGEPQENAEIVSLEMAKKNSVIEADYEDDLLQLYLDSATAEIENYIGGPVLLRENSSYKVDHWFKSLQAPQTINAITQVSYKDAEGAEQVLAEEDYYLNISTNTIIISVEEPTDFKEPLIVSCSLGYSKVPADIKRAALLIFSNAETYRENAPVKLETAAKGLLRPYKIY